MTARIHPPFTVCAVPENASDAVRIHPQLTRLPGGRLILAVNHDGDVHDAEMLMFASDDGGHTWAKHENWPGATRHGHNLATVCLALDDGSVWAACSSLLLATADPGVFYLPAWRSLDGGHSWGAMSASRIELPAGFGETLDLYHPSGEEQESELARWRKPEPPPAVQEVCGQWGWQRLLAGFMSPVSLGNGRLLAFIYFAPRWGEPYITVCVASDDSGGSWHYLSTPGPYDARFQTDSFLSHAVDGLCEPSCVRLRDGDLLLVMRLGSRHPLYTVRSRDSGNTWVPDGERGPDCHYADRPCRPISVCGILPSLVALPGGAVALCAGRPDVTLSFSLDGGYHWPATWRFLENDKPEDASTCNNTMVAVSPGRLLLMYDVGGFRGKVPELRGPRRIVAHFVDVELA